MDYKIYGLIHPITMKICYIGCTIQKLEKRLSQHNQPKKSNSTKIAKLRRSLKSRKFSITLLKVCETREDMYLSEVDTIKKFTELGIKLYNITEGGEGAPHTEESIQKMLKSREENDVWRARKGEECYNSKLNESEVLVIYSLIKKFYSNEEIMEEFGGGLNRTWLTSIRFGQSWKHLFKQHFSEPIPSLKNFNKNSYSGRVKVKIVELLDKGYEVKQIERFFKKIKAFDLVRIRDKKLWIPVWDVYHKFVQRTMVVTS
jgi:hypothetical protein